MSSLNDAALWTKFRNMAIEFGYEPFVLIGVRGQHTVVHWHKRGDVDDRLLKQVMQEVVDGFNVIEDDEVWRDSE